VSSVVSASQYSGYSAVLACGSCKCLYAGVAGGSHSALHVSASALPFCTALLLDTTCTQPAIPTAQSASDQHHTTALLHLGTAYACTLCTLAATRHWRPTICLPHSHC
jgi:hypothetical protein